MDSTLLAAEIRALQKQGRRICLYIDTTKELANTAELTTAEVGREAKKLLRGEPSLLAAGVVKIRSRAMARRGGWGWNKTRARIFARDGYKCTYCGATDNLECDHILPIAKGGGDGDENLAAACRPCNLSKRDKLLEDWRK